MPFQSQPSHHTWTTEEKITLFLLNRIYVNKGNDLLTVFNAQFARGLQREGFLDGLSRRAFTAMYAEISGRSKSKEPWKTLNALDVAELKREFDVERNAIENVAEKQGIELCLRAQHLKTAVAPAPLSSPKLPSRSHVKTQSQTKRPFLRHRASTVPNSGQSDSDSEWYPDTPSKSPRAQITILSEARHRPVLAIRYDSASKAARVRPLLLFRVYDKSHGFKSRKVLSTTTIGNPPPATSEEFRRLVWPHLNVDVNYESPFISFAQNPVNALRRIGLSNTLAFAIFETNAIEEDARNSYGEEAGLYLVTRICKTHSINDLPSGYTGVGEWLAWGEIKARPVAVLDTVEALMLKKVLETTHGLSFEIGKRVGSHLNMVTEFWREVVAYRLIRSFKVPGADAAPVSQQYYDFVRGIYHVSPSTELSNKQTAADQPAMYMDDWASSSDSSPEEFPTPAASSPACLNLLSQRAEAPRHDDHSSIRLKRNLHKQSAYKNTNTPPTSPLEMNDHPATPSTQHIIKFRSELQRFVAHADNNVFREDLSRSRRLPVQQKQQAIDLTNDDDDDDDHSIGKDVVMIDVDVEDDHNHDHDQHHNVRTTCSSNRRGGITQEEDEDDVIFISASQVTFAPRSRHGIVR